MGWARRSSMRRGRSTKARSESGAGSSGNGGHSETHIWPLVVIVPKHRAAFGAEAALGIAHLLGLVVLVKLYGGVVDPGSETMSVTTMTGAASYLKIIGTILELRGDQSKRPLLPVSDPRRPQP